MADVNPAPQRQIALSINGIIALAGIIGTFISAVVVVVFVYYTGSVVPMSKDIAELKTDMANVKAANSQMRSDISAIHTENINSYQLLSSAIDQVKSVISDIREKIAAFPKR